MWSLRCTQSNHCPRSLSYSTHSRNFPATKWKKALFQVGYCPSILSDTDGSRRHCEDSCNHTLGSLRVLKNALWSSQRFIDQVFSGLEIFYANIDEVLFANSNPDEYKLNLRQVFQRLDQYIITANPEKCNFGQTEIDFLGPSRQRTRYFTSAREDPVNCGLPHFTTSQKPSSIPLVW